MTSEKQPHKILVKQIERTSKELESDQNLSSEIKERIGIINALMIQIFLDPKDIETHNLLGYIYYLVNRFNLDISVCAFDILIETYTVAIQKTRAGYVIKNPPAWFKSTAFNIINNLKRERKKECFVKKILEENQSNDITIELTDQWNNELDMLIKALEILNEEDRYILNLRIVKGLTWADIANQMIAEGKACSISVEFLARLRKRHQRALERLRRCYQIV